MWFKGGADKLMRASTSRKRQTGRTKKREEDNFLHPLCSSKWIIQNHTLILQWEVQTLPCKWHSCSILGNETLKGSVDVQSRLSHKCPPEERSEGRRRRHDDWPEWGSLIKVVLRVERRWFSDWMTDWLRWRRMAEKASCTEAHTHNRAWASQLYSCFNSTQYLTT